MKSEQITFRGKMKGQAFGKLQKTYLGIPLIIQRKELKQSPISIAVKGNRRIQMGKKSKVQVLIEVEAGKGSRNNIDIVCVIDISGSMEGEKIKKVKETMKILIEGNEIRKYIHEDDQISIVLFNNTATTLVEMQKITSENKKTILDKIDSISASCTTQIGLGIEKALQNIEKRSHRNKVVTVFLLSDGAESQNPKQNVIQIIDKYPSSQIGNYTINSFCYGDSYDVDKMNSIRNKTGGRLYHVMNIGEIYSEFQKYFTRAVQTAATGVKLKLKKISEKYLKDVEIGKIYGNEKWKKKQENEYEIQIPQLAGSSKRSFLFDMEVPEINQKIKNKIEEAVFEFRLEGQGIKSSMKKGKVIKFEIVNDDKIEAEVNLEVLQKTYHFRTYQTIEKCIKEAEEKKKEEAQKKITELLQEISSNGKIGNKKSSFLQDNLNQFLKQLKNWDDMAKKRAVNLLILLNESDLFSLLFCTLYEQTRNRDRFKEQIVLYGFKGRL